MANPENNKSLRYSDAELAEFEAIILGKITNAQEQVNQLEEQVIELNESLQTSGADLGDTSAYSDVEFMSNMIFRQQKHIQDLENALLRIKNKTYGVCVLTGELIDKKRLMIVPTTTKGLAAKTEDQKKEEAKSNPRRIPAVERKPTNHFKKVVEKIKEKKVQPKKPLLEDDDEDFDGDDTIDEMDLGEMDMDGLDD